MALGDLSEILGEGQFSAGVEALLDVILESVLILHLFLN